MPPIDVICPDDVTLPCTGFENTNPDVGVTGDITVIISDTCNIIAVVGPLDDRAGVINSDDEKVFRTWVVTNWCTGEEIVCVQKIVLVGCSGSGPVASFSGQTLSDDGFKVDGVNVSMDGVTTTSTANGTYNFYNLDGAKHTRLLQAKMTITKQVLTRLIS